MCDYIKLLLFISLFSLFQLTDCYSSSQEDSESIEIPNRPENRQEYKQATTRSSPSPDPQTLLHLLSKLLDSVKQTIHGTTTEIQKNDSFKRVVQKTRRAYFDLHKAYRNAERAKDQFVRKFMEEASKS